MTASWNPNPLTLRGFNSRAENEALFGYYNVQSWQDNITAAGTNLATATQLKAANNRVTTVAPGTGVVLPSTLNPPVPGSSVPFGGLSVTIMNSGANNLTVYAPTGETVGGGASATVAPGSMLALQSFSVGAWYTISSTPISQGSGSSTFLNVKDYGAKGDGVTDDSTSINNALTALNTAGGGTLYFPPSTSPVGYLMATSTLIPPSNSIMQGSGIDATIITNTSTAGQQDCVLTVVMTMTSGTNAGLWTANNTTYAINAPTAGAKTVTTTTAANAGNFAAGNIIMVSGGFGSTAFWFPSWYTTVVSANAGTGVITLNETLPFGGSGITTVQKIISLPQNITVRDMTLRVNSNVGGSSGAIMEILGCESFLAENLKFVNATGLGGASCAIGAPVRRSGFRNCHATAAAGPIELFGASESFIEGCSAINSYFLMDGGTMDSTFSNNHCKDSQKDDGTGNGFHGLHIPDYATRNKIVGSSFIGIPNGFAGVNVSAGIDSNRNHTIVGCTFIGAGGSGGSGTGINTSDGVVVGNVFSNLANGIQMQGTLATPESPIIEGNYFDLANPNGTNIAPFATPGFFRTRQSPTVQALTGGTSTPTLQGGQVLTLTQSVTTNVSSFLGGLPGDDVTIVVQDTKTVFVNGGTLVMKSGANYNPQAANIVMSFVCTSSGVWTEKSRSA